jgi:hypothetical protein
MVKNSLNSSLSSAALAGNSNPSDLANPPILGDWNDRDAGNLIFPHLLNADCGVRNVDSTIPNFEI